MIRVVSVVALLGSAWTLFCGGLIFAAQISGLPDDAQDFSVRSTLAKLSLGGAVYNTASETVRVGPLQHFLDLPVFIPLLIAAALQLAFYVWLQHLRTQSE